MNQQEKYRKYALCREMAETVEVLRNFRTEGLEPYAAAIQEAGTVMLTGEGSSRIFPAKNTIARELRKETGLRVFTEGATQAQEYDLRRMCVLGASNSGKTKELIRLFYKLKQQGHPRLYGLTAYADSPLETICRSLHVLHCGPEKAVAATKSVVEQALFYQGVFDMVGGKDSGGYESAAECMAQALALPVPPGVVEKIAQAETVYFAGRNNGVAEELTLKTNEIVRKKSDFLEGTYAAHGIEEVMTPRDVVIVIDPFEEEEGKFLDCLHNGVGATLIALAPRKTGFPFSLLLPEAGDFNPFIQLAAGWNLLVEAGLALGVDLDSPVRARKVGNAMEAV